MGSRAGIIVTGTEVLTGRVADRNGPWLAEQLRQLGVDVAHTVIVGDRAADVQQALGFLTGQSLDLVLTSGGLGPTADDLTADVVGQFQGRTSQLDPQLAEHIAEIVATLSAGRGWRMDPAATAAATRKQAMVPEGASVLAPVGTAPGLVIPPAAGRTGPPVVVLPGPPRELQGMWPAALADPLVQSVIGTGAELHQRTMRLWGTPESELAATMREHSSALADLEITTCLRDGELEIVTRYGSDSESAYAGWAEVVRTAYGETLFSADGRTVDDIVADCLRSANLTIATAESCTGGLLAARLTDLPGSSDYLLGGAVVYSNEAKQNVLGVSAELIEQFGAVSEPVAEAMAGGARVRYRADIGVGITGVAGPDGGTAMKPVGLVHICVESAHSSLARRVLLPGDRADVRKRAVVVAMHMIRVLLGAGQPQD